MEKFRKKFAIITSIIAAVILFGAIVFHVVTGDPGRSLSSNEMNALLLLMGIATASYGAARALPGSPEYTNPELRQFDSTLNAKPNATPAPPFDPSKPPV